MLPRIFTDYIEDSLFTFDFHDSISVCYQQIEREVCVCVYQKDSAFVYVNCQEIKKKKPERI